MKFFEKIKNFFEEVERKELQKNIKNLTKKFKEKHNKKKTPFIQTILNECEAIMGYFSKIFQNKVEMYLFLKEVVETIVFVIVAVILIRFFVGELRFIPSASMRNTLIEGDRVFVQKMTFWNRELKKGDIVVFYPPDEKLEQDFKSIFARYTGIFCNDIAFIKRIVATPGDKFEIKTENALSQLKECIFQVACDVKNPLCGDNGCSAIYGPQKGATPDMIKDMDRWLENFARLTN